MKLRRTLLWVNGNDEKKLQAGIHSDADAIVLELEDLVPAPEKDAARAGAARALREVDFRGKERLVRPNDLSTPRGQADLEAILPGVPDAIRVPKCESVETLRALDERLTRFERENNLPHGRIEIVLVLETPLGILRGYELATCCSRVTGMGLGAGDLTAAMGVDRDLTPGSLQLLWAKQKMVMDGKAAGVQIFDTTVITQGENDLDDFIREDTAFIKTLGFTGRSVSMLPHIAIINEVFAPTPQEESLARRIISGYEEGMAQGLSEIFVDGHFVDPPVVAKAQSVVDLAEQIHAKR